MKKKKIKNGKTRIEVTRRLKNLIDIVLRHIIFLTIEFDYYSMDYQDDAHKSSCDADLERNKFNYSPSRILL